MREISASEARTNFSQFLDHAEHGEEIIITRRGRAVAKLVPAAVDFDGSKARRAVTGILELSRGVTLGGLKIKNLIDEGRP